MSSLQKMIDLLRPTGLYRFSDDSNVLKELSAYAAGLDLLNKAFDELEKEAFVQTAQSDGLKFWERLFHLSFIEDDFALRQQRLLGLLSMADDALCKKELVDQFALFGATVTIAENISDQKLTVSGVGHIGSHRDMRDIVAEFESIWPAHMGGTLDINAGTWYYWDGCGITFETWGNSGYSFNDYSARVRAYKTY